MARPKTILLLTLPAILGVFAYNAFTDSNGPSGGYTGAPSENACNSCHTGTLRTAGTNWLKIKLLGNFTGNGYIPDSTYTLTVTYRESGRARYGFQITCLTAANDPAGTFTATNTRVKRVTASVSGKTREYIEHTSTGTSPVVSDSVAWTFSWKAPSANLGNLVFYVALNATNNNSNSSGDSIFTKKFTVAPSTLLPKATAGADVSSSCTGYGVQFKGSGTNSPTSYSWSFPTGTPTTSTAQNPLVTYTSAGTKLAILTVRNSKGISKPDTFRLTVLQSPSAVIGGANTVTICPGDSLRLTANSVPGASYFWPSLNRSGVSVFVKDSGNYSVRVTANNGCMATSQPVKVLWYPVPATQLSLSADSLCSNQTLNLTATATGADSFLFYRNGKLLATQKSNVYVDLKPIQDGRYSARSKGTNGCPGPLSAEKKIFVRTKSKAPAPLMTTQKSTRIGFAWAKVSGALRYEISGDSGKTWQTADTDTSHLFTGLKAASDYRFHFRVLNASPCNPSDTFLIVSTPGCGGRVITVLHEDSICVGNQTLVIVRGLGGSRYSTSLGGIYSRDTIYILKPAGTATYNLTVKDSSDLSCPDFRRSFSIRVDTPSLLSVQYSKLPGSLCVGDTLLVSAGSGFSNYELRVNNVLTGTNSSGKLQLLPGTANSKDSLMVIGRKAACAVKSAPAELLYRSLPDASFKANGYVIFNFMPNDTGLQRYQWDFGDGNTSLAKKPTHQYGMASYFKTLVVGLQVRDAFGCSSADTSLIFVGGPDGVTEASAAGFNVFPIPAGNELNIVSEQTGTMMVQLLTMQGQQVGAEVQGSGKLRIPLEGIGQGTYLLLIELRGRKYYRSVSVVNGLR